jgi:molybdenum cofactor synthesis domain-containing protein
LSATSKKHKAHAPKSVNFAVFICSTSRYQAMQRGEQATDVSGDTIEALLKDAGHRVLFRRVIADDKDMIEHAVKSVLDNPGVDAAVFSGGTGVTGSDVTIESVSPFLEKTLPPSCPARWRAWRKAKPCFVYRVPLTLCEFPSNYLYRPKRLISLSTLGNNDGVNGQLRQTSS